MKRQGRSLVLTLFLLAIILIPPGCQKGPTAPNGLSLSLVKGYKDWPLISVSYRQDLQELHIILGNTTALEDFIHGIPDNGYPFTDGAILVRLIYTARASGTFPHYLAPGRFKGLDFMIKDAERFKSTRGWGYASFLYHPEGKTFKPSSTRSPEECLKCHELVQKRDYVFTPYTPRGPKRSP